MAGFKTYVQEATHELMTKVSWPTWKELQTSAIIVLVTCIIISLLVWLMDFTLGIWPSEEEGSFWKGLLGFFYEAFNPS